MRRGYCRSAGRDAYDPEYAYGFVGFRVVLAPVLKEKKRRNRKRKEKKNPPEAGIFL